MKNLTFNERLRYIRKEILHLTGMELAGAFGYTQATVSNIENARPPYDKIESSERYIKAICIKYNVNEQWIHTGEGEIYITHETQDDWVLRMFRELKPEYQERILAIARQIIEEDNKKNSESAGTGNLEFWTGRLVKDD